MNQVDTNVAGAGQVVWITGLSGAGKSTLAQAFAAGLRAQGQSVVVLDGDELREVFGNTADRAQNYDRAARLALAMQYAHLCRVIAAQGHIVVIATISLFHEVHAWNRSQLPGYFEVYLQVPLEELRRRDPKGIYRRFDAGELHNVAGLDLSIDEPSAADWAVAFEPQRTLATLTEDLLHRFYKRKLV
ncbi:adenylyl-sulfate kinase [Pseudomonas sp. SDI]|uniref:adenylyl-sulfate kinase n=1 Tax=Pseudomonas sp. SDI TaxID=2170734 RepID=UPI000DE6FD3C|nr:adenylyl-sulfate kinase [Pseudomonas sp. SDI]PWB35388.1 adenylyl-sulfate kinase [Pseudomonas sp. SDI]